MNSIIRSITILLIMVASLWAAPAEGSVAPNKKLYDFSFVDIEFDAAFRSLSITAGVDILLAPEVKGKLNLKVSKKTWQETLDIICELHDLVWLIQDKYITIQRLATYQAKQKKIAEQEEQSEQVSPLIRKNFSIRHAKAQDLVSVLESMKSPRGKITVVERSNSIIVYDTDARISQMKNALDELDVETLQIMITAKLVVVNSNLARELGVDWTSAMGSATLTPGVASTPAGSNVGGTRTSGAIQSFPNNGVSGLSGAATSLTASVLDNNLQIAINSIMGDASTEVLASPQVSTLDNTEAIVFMGDKISIRVIDDSGESSTQLVETGIKLTVTPHVSGDNRILLDLHPENNSYDYDTKGEVVISTQEAKTKVVVADGETVVIGGLTRNENVESESGIPFLKDIPILGNLFKYTKKSVTKKDLVIFVTPRIIRNYIGNVETSEPSEVKVQRMDESAPVTPTKEESNSKPVKTETTTQRAPAEEAPVENTPVQPQVETQNTVEPAPETVSEPPPAPAGDASTEEEDW